jgi:hypothetical protein
VVVLLVTLIAGKGFTVTVVDNTLLGQPYGSIIVAVYEVVIVGVVTVGLAKEVLFKKVEGAQVTPVVVPVKYKLVELPKQTLTGGAVGIAPMRFTIIEQLPDTLAVLTAVHVIVNVPVLL